jgi:hypothetical protein
MPKFSMHTKYKPISVNSFDSICRDLRQI